MELSSREKKIVKIVQKYEPITGDEIAKELSLSKSTIRTELSLLVKVGILESKTNVGYFYNNKKLENLKYDYLKSIKVSEVMGLGVTSTIDEKVPDVISKLFIHDLGTIFIVDKNKNLVGVVSRKDLLKLVVANTNSNNLPIAMAMTRMPNIVYTYADENLLDPLRKLINHEIDCLPVVKVQDEIIEVIGRISKTTLTRVMLDILEG